MRDDRLDNQINYNNEAGQSKLVKTVQFETLPTDPTNTNPVTVITYNSDGQISTITKTINSINYVKTYTWANGLLTNISQWVEA